jgi:hypothetical protein
MTTARQIAANRRNARRSTGARSAAGSKRSSRNSFRHGLAAGVTATAERIKYIERLARKIVGASTDVVTFENARTVAQATFELAQIRRVKVALISHVMAFGGFGTPDASQSLDQQVNQLLRWLKRGELVSAKRAEIPVMPETEPERTAEAVRRALPELIKFDRYERRAAVRRARALHSFLEWKKCKTTWDR